MLIASFTRTDEIYVLGSEFSVNPSADEKARALFSSAGYRELLYLHNHPSTNLFSLADIDTFVTYAQIGLLSVVTNQGEVYILHKTRRYDYQRARGLLLALFEETHGDFERMTALFLHRCKEVGIDYGKSK